MLDRINQPSFNIPKHIELTAPSELELTNGIPVYSFHADKQDLIKIDFMFALNHDTNRLPLISAMTSTMLNEGTSERSAVEIANQIDYYGCFLKTQTTRDTAIITLYSLNKHLKNILPIIEEIIKESIFPENELEIAAKNAKQKFLVKIKEVDFHAQLEFNTDIFGANHAYGYKISEEDYNLLNRKELLKFYSRTYGSNNCKIMLTGNITNNTIKLMNKHFGNSDWVSEGKKGREVMLTEMLKSDPKYIKKENAIQCAIRIGKLMFNKRHEDFIKLQVLNTVLGGYFGSRLMSNLREDKGLTYGVYSTMNSYRSGGSLLIAMETGVDNSELARNEIYFEIKRLREQKIDAKELKLVRNYLYGELLRSTDGIFSTSDFFKGLILYDLNSSYLSDVMRTINEIKPIELQELAQKYFSEDTMQELVVG